MWFPRRGWRETSLGPRRCSASSRRCAGKTWAQTSAWGGSLRKHRLQKKRVGNSKKRRRRIGWWRSIGGDAALVAKTGENPGVTYGAAVVGLLGRSFQELCRSNAVATAGGGAGASLKAHLALGGADFSDITPGVSDAAAPLLAIVSLVRDELAFPGCVVDAWRRAIKTIDPSGKVWSKVAGPVGAARAPLARIGAEWPRPFEIRCLDQDVSLLKVPPLQVREILRAHARRHFDRKVVAHILAEEQLSVLSGRLWVVGQARHL